MQTSFYSALLFRSAILSERAESRVPLAPEVPEVRVIAVCPRCRERESFRPWSPWGKPAACDCAGAA